MEYTPKEFNMPELKGLSAKQIEVHLGLYKGYVTHVNLLREQIAELTKEGAEKYAYAITETRRRLGFEFGGMRMHEYYFEQFESGTSDQSASLNTMLSTKYGSWEDFLEHFKQVGMSRGIGWTVLYYDPVGQTPHVAWVSDHELGTLAGLPILLAMDMWEHAFMVDYTPAEKGQYIAAFLSNVNWDVAAQRYKQASK